MRKFVIGFISFGIVLGLFLLYYFVSAVPQVAPDKADQIIDNAIDSNAAGMQGVLGKVGDVGIGRFEMALFKKLNPITKELEREFGFKELLHKVGDEWETEKPFMNIYQRTFDCYVTADKGIIRLETVGSRHSPKDAVFTGNVDIHIVPKGPGRFKQCHIYMDDIIFLSDKSQFSTAGPVRFVSADAKLFGTGMELIYNDVMQRLEYFRIIDLDKLIIVAPQGALFETQEKSPPSRKKTAKSAVAKADTPAAPKAEKPEKAATPGDPEKKPAVPNAETESVEPAKGEHYICMFSKNVVIDSPDQVIFADKKFFINDIFWSKTPGENTDVNDSNSPGAASPQISDANTVSDKKTAAEKSGDPNKVSEELIDIVITCDNGLVVAPVDSPRAAEDFTKADKQPGDPNAYKRKLDAAAGRTTFVTQWIDYNAPSGDTFFTGPSELTLYVEDSNSTDPNAAPVPVKVTAQKRVTFYKASNEVIFEGSCLLKMPQEGLTVPKYATLSAPRLIFNLPEKSSDKSNPFSDMTAPGPAELIFYVEDSNSADPNKTNAAILPVNVTAQKQVRFLSASNQLIFEGDSLCKIPRDSSGKNFYTLSSPTLTVDLPKKKSGRSFALPDIHAAGPAVLDFTVDDLSGSKAPKEPLPAKITAQKQARFLSSTKQAIFEGACRTTMVRHDPNFIEEFTLISETITVDFPKDTNDRSSDPALGIERLTAEGGVVRLASEKKAKGKSLGGIELECRKFVHDLNQGLFTATGPGMIKFDNSKAIVPEPNDPNGQSETFSLKQPCWAIIENYDTLKYFTRANRIVADAGSQGSLTIHYFPFKDGEFTQHIIATASHIVVDLVQDANDQTELSTLRATGGITYKDDNNQFIGSELFYDHAKSLMKVNGDRIQSCYFNGALVEDIEYNLKTGEVKAKGIGPGPIQLK